MAKLKIDDIVAKMKEGVKGLTPKKPQGTPVVAKPVQPTTSGIRVRDMRQEAREQGSHGAEEYFGKDQV